MIREQAFPSIRSVLDSTEVFWNLDEKILSEHCVERDDCILVSNGSVAAYSGEYTGRTPRDKYIVQEESSQDKIWWGPNNPMPAETFDRVRARIASYLSGERLYVVDTIAGADPKYQIRARFIVERPYHALFIRQLLIKPTEEQLREFEPDWVVVDAGKLHMDPVADGIRSKAVIALSMDAGEVWVAGTQYAGELKKSVFTVMNYLLPLQGVLGMHCSANIGPKGDTALFFGLSGTGKTSLSADPERNLIGDDEHGWSDEGVFNIEGGCYAKCIGLSREKEPEIWDALGEGTLLENVVVSSEGVPDYNDRSITENTRAAYPLDHIPNALQPSVGGHPTNIVFLTCDALGLLPPISRLTADQAITFFLNGYTAKVAGTEAGITEPTVTFSACFGQPFLPFPPQVYAELLRDKIRRHGSKVWLLNTGWTGGPYGVGHRIDISLTRAMLEAAIDGKLDSVAYTDHPVFGLHSPAECPNVPSELLNPRETWADRASYDVKARELQAMFEANALKMSSGVL